MLREHTNAVRGRNIVEPYCLRGILGYSGRPNRPLFCNKDQHYASFLILLSRYFKMLTLDSSPGHRCNSILASGFKIQKIF